MRKLWFVGVLAFLPGMAMGQDASNNATPPSPASNAGKSDQIWYAMGPTTWANFQLSQNDTSLIQCHISEQSPKQIFSNDEILNLNPSVSKSYATDGSLISVTITAMLSDSTTQEIAYTYFTSAKRCRDYYVNQAEQQEKLTKDLQ